eukprot:GHVR01114539.1.p1 GENE.GHVR01114539.1~~GHVR01114539.1.p1  ORF type:complete len:307 (-),score=75.22 GHVR01114539.1:54-941(-)
MPLEATLICMDNSEWTRNGDFAPTRFAAQTDAANIICGAKTQQHPESSVGLLTMAGEQVMVRVTPTQDISKLLSSLHNIAIGGNCDFVRGIQIAQLALKHRQNKNQRQRIVCFVGSPICADEKRLETLGRTLKKNNVAIDIISFGEVDVNSNKLQKLQQSVDANQTSHLLEVIDGMLADVVLMSPICQIAGEDGSAAGAGVPGVGTSGGVNEFGIDPITDPELFMALRMSLEESQREERERQAQAGGLATLAEEQTGPQAPTQGDDSHIPHILATGGTDVPTAADIQAMVFEEFI